MCIELINVIKNLITSIFSKRLSTDRLPPVQNFELDRYLGLWYEIGRYDHSFQKGLSNVRTIYSKRNDQLISIINSGTYGNTTKEITGIGKFKSSTDIGLFKISFFRPIWSDYKIVYLDLLYNSAIITSSTMDYLWILSRTKNISDGHRSDLIKICTNLGFNPLKIVWN